MTDPLAEGLPQRLADWLAGLLLSFWVWLNCEPGSVPEWTRECSAVACPPPPRPPRKRPLYSPPRR